MYTIVEHYDYLDELTIEKINSKAKDNKILIEFDNTKHIDLNYLKKLSPNVDIRIIGAYTDERYNFYKNSDVKFKVEYYKTANIYKKEELIKIIEKLEELERGASPYWSDLQKVLYFLEKISSLLYPPSGFDVKQINEITSLRGLIENSKSICTGCALIFKEIMDRCGIECYYEEGLAEEGNFKSGHAWNIVKIHDKYYPVDLMFNILNYNVGITDSTNVFANEDFYKNHIPIYSEKKLDYKHDLSSIDPDLVNQMYSDIMTSKEMINTTFKFLRNDGSRFLISEVGNKNIDGKNYFAYYYAEIIDGKLSRPIILYSDTNYQELISYDKNHNEDSSIARNIIVNSLFSLSNIKDSIRRKSLYIGNVENADLVKDESIMKKFNTNSISSQIRKDGTTFIIEKIDDKYPQLNSYRYYDLDIINNKFVSNVKTIHTENNLFVYNNKKLSELLLRKKHIDDCVKYRSGYLGKISRKGFSLIVDYDLIMQAMINNKLFITYEEPSEIENISKNIKNK